MNKLPVKPLVIKAKRLVDKRRRMVFRLDKLKKERIFASMKKIAVAILAILYLGVSSGIAMEIHYCMGKKSGVDFYGENGKKCGKCGMKEKKGCCSDEHKFLKLSDSHKNVSNEISFSLPAIALVPVGIPLNCVRFNAAPAVDALKNNSPPIYTGPSACIMNCVFRI